MTDKTIIFLDLDGVLITQWSELQPIETRFKEFAKPFQKQGVDIINQIIDEYNAEIVLSSDWRYVFNKQMLGEYFKMNEINQIPIPMPYDYRSEFRDKKSYPNYKELRRSKEIEMYVTEHKIKRFVIFDDLALMCFPDNFIKTEFSIGLTIEYKERVKTILNA